MSTPTSRRRSLWVIVAAATLAVMAGAILGPMVPQIQAELGVSQRAAGTAGLALVALAVARLRG